MKASEFALSNYGLHVEGLLDAISHALKQATVSARVVLRCRLVIEELAVNAIRHGGATDVVVTVVVSNRISITIQDDGLGFDPFSSVTPDISEALTERSIGGLGLHIIRSECSETRYMRSGQFNIMSVEIEP